MADGRGLLHGYLGGGDMAVGMVVVMALLVLNIVGMCVLWYELDVLERIRRGD